MPVATPGRGPTITEWRHQTVYRKYKKSKAARQDISVKEIDVPFIQSYSMFSLDILCLLQGFKMGHNKLFLHTKPGTHLFLPGQALFLHEGRDPPLNQLIAGEASQVKARFKNCTPANAPKWNVMPGDWAAQVTVCAYWWEVFRQVAVLWFVVVRSHLGQQYWCVGKGLVLFHSQTPVSCWACSKASCHLGLCFCW